MHVLLIFLIILQGSFAKSGTFASSHPFCTAPLGLHSELSWDGKFAVPMEMLWVLPLALTTFWGWPRAGTEPRHTGGPTDHSCSGKAPWHELIKDPAALN